MNIKRLGIPIYASKGDENIGEYIILQDLKLAMDSDLFVRLMAKAQVAGFGKTIPISWLENYYD